MALLMARDIVKDCAIILLTIVLETMADGTTEAIPSYTSTMLSSIIILIVPKTLYNIIAIVKQFIVVELTI